MSLEIPGLARRVFMGGEILVAFGAKVDRPAVHFDLILLVSARAFGQPHSLMIPGNANRRSVVGVVVVRLKRLKPKAPTSATIATRSARI